MLEDFILPRGKSQNAVARAIGVTPRSVNEIVLGRRGISAAMSIRLGQYFGLSPSYWLEKQMVYDLEQALEEMGDAVDDIIVAPVKKPALKKSSIDEDERTTWLL